MSKETDWNAVADGVSRERGESQRLEEIDELIQEAEKRGAERMYAVISEMIELGAFKAYLNKDERNAAIWEAWEEFEKDNT